MELPQSTVYGRIIAKDKLFEHGRANSELKEIIAKQVGRIRWANKIAPGTMNLAPDDDNIEIELIEIELRVPFAELDRRVLPLIVKAIPYSLLFKLYSGKNEYYSVIYGGKIYSSETSPKVIGNGIKSVWENIVRQIANIPLCDKPIEEIIAENNRLKKQKQRIDSLERKARAERQTRRKLEYANEIKK